MKIFDLRRFNWTNNHRQSKNIYQNINFWNVNGLQHSSWTINLLFKQWRGDWQFKLRIYKIKLFPRFLNILKVLKNYFFVFWKYVYRLGFDIFTRLLSWNPSATQAYFRYYEILFAEPVNWFQTIGNQLTTNHKKYDNIDNYCVISQIVLFLTIRNQLDQL